MTLMRQRQIRQGMCPQSNNAHPQVKWNKDLFCNTCLNVLQLCDVTTSLSSKYHIYSAICKEIIIYLGDKAF